MKLPAGGAPGSVVGGHVAEGEITERQLLIEGGEGYLCLR